MVSLLTLPAVERKEEGDHSTAIFANGQIPGARGAKSVL
jgi:hypothetical protein